MRENIDKVLKELRPYVLTPQERELLETKERIDQWIEDQLRKTALPEHVLQSKPTAER